MKAKAGNGHCDCGHGDCGHDHGAVSGVSFAEKAKPAERGVSLGAEYEEEIAQAMQKRYRRFLKPGEVFTAKTEVCHQFGLVSAHLRNAERTTNLDVEVSIDCDDNMIENPIEASQKALDVLDTVLLEYFDSDRISHYLPIWQNYEVGDLTANVRLEHGNPALDDEASAFLQAHGFTDGGLLPEPEEDYGDVEPVDG